MNYIERLHASIAPYLPEVLNDWIFRIQSSPLGVRFAKGASWILLGAVISRMLGLLSSILVARILGQTVFGELGIIQSTVGMLGTFAGFGLSITALKYVAELKIKDPERAGRIIYLSQLFSIITGAAMSLGLVASASFLAENALASPDLSIYLQISAMILFFNALMDTRFGSLAGFEAFKTITKINVMTGILTFPLMLGGAYLSGLWGATWALVASSAIGFLFSYRALVQKTRINGVQVSRSGSISELPLLWKFSLPAFLSSILVMPVNWACHAMLVNQADGYKEMGAYNAANQWFNALLFLPGILAQVMLPIMSEKIGNDEASSSNVILKYSVKLNILVVWPIVVLGGVSSPIIMGLYGESFADYWPTLIAILITAGILSIQLPVGQTITASGKMWAVMVINIAWASTFLIFTYTWVEWGSFGLALSRCCANFIHFIFTLIFAYHYFSRDDAKNQFLHRK